MTIKHTEQLLEFSSYDGVHLQGTFLQPAETDPSDFVVLVHGIGGDRNENGLYESLAYALSKARIPSFRFDWRCHGFDGSRPLTGLTLSGVHNDLMAAIKLVRQQRKMLPTARLVLIAHSFSSAIVADWAVRNQSIKTSVVLLNPVLNYVDEYLRGEDVVENGRMSKVANLVLSEQGSISVQGRVFSRAMCNEMISFPDLSVPPDMDFWIIHAADDTSVLVDFSEKFVKDHHSVDLTLVSDAEHGFLDAISLPPDRKRTEKLWKLVSSEIVARLDTGRSQKRL